MFNYIGNYEHVIPNSWVAHMNAHTGEIRPNTRMVMTEEVARQQKEWTDIGYHSEGSMATWELLCFIVLFIFFPLPHKYDAP